MPLIRAALVMIALVLAASPARAEHHYSVAAFGGYAAEGRTFVIGGTSAYRAGFGVRAGVSIPKLYLGVLVTHHLGTRDSLRSPGLTYDARYNTTLVGPEIGYDAAIGTRGLIRPYVGGGVLYEHSRTTMNGAVNDRSNYRGHVTFGFVFAYRVQQLSFGLDLRGVISPFHDATRWTPGAFGMVGYTF